MILGSPAWNPQATLALVTTVSIASSSPRVQAPNPSPTSLLRSTCARTPLSWCLVRTYTPEVRPVIVAFSVTPLGVGEAVGDVVAEAVRVVRDSGLPNQTDAMFTTLEGDWDEVMD